MKKMLACIPVILFPYTIPVLTVLLIRGFLTDPDYQNFSLFILLFTLVLWISAILCSLAVSIISRIKKFSGLEMAKLNMLVKIIQVPAYMLIFIFGMFSFITIFTMGFSVVYLFLDMISIILTGFIGASAVCLNYRQGVINKAEVILYTILQFVFCLDVIIAVLVYMKSKIYSLKSEQSL